MITVPCGKCVACKKNYVQDWTIRLIDESKMEGRHYFLTLTYSDEPLAYSKEHIQKFIKKLRNELSSITIRYFICGERGSLRGRVHYHAILYTSSYIDISSNLVDSWSYGFIKIGSVTPRSCAYVAKYIVPTDPVDRFLLMSRKPGIGFGKITSEYIRSQEQNPRGYITQGGYRKSLPRYYRTKLSEHAIVFPKQSLADQQRPLIAYEEEHGDSDLARFKSGLPTYREEQHTNEEFLYLREEARRKSHNS